MTNVQQLIINTVVTAEMIIFHYTILNDITMYIYIYIYIHIARITVQCFGGQKAPTGQCYKVTQTAVNVHHLATRICVARPEARLRNENWIDGLLHGGAPAEYSVAPNKHLSAI